MVKEQIRYCRKCGAFIPAWSDTCLSCGYDDLEPRKRVAKEKSNVVCLDNLSGVSLGGLKLENAYVTDTKVIFGGGIMGTSALLELRIVGDVVRDVVGDVDMQGQYVYYDGKG